MSSVKQTLMTESAAAESVQLPNSVMASHVLVIAPAPPPYGGMALQARLLERLLCSDGHTVTFLASNAPFPKSLQFLDRIRGLRPFPRAVLLCMNLWKATAHADVMHVFAASWLYFFVVVAPCVAIGRIHGVRVILNYRGGEAAPFLRWFRWAAWPVFKAASVIVTPSEFLAGTIRKAFGVRVEIVPNIVNLSLFTFRLRTFVRPRMVVSRHLEKSYDIESVLRAFQIVQQHYPEASLCIAGTGSQSDYLCGLAKSLNLAHVQFMGHLTQAELQALYTECDILLNASLVDNFPGALLEGSAAGLVVVSTAAGGIPFIYRNEEDALLVEPGNWTALGNAVLRVLADPPLARRLAANANLVARQCDWANVRRILYHCYRFAEGSM